MDIHLAVRGGRHRRSGSGVASHVRRPVIGLQWLAKLLDRWPSAPRAERQRAAYRSAYEVVPAHRDTRECCPYCDTIDWRGERMARHVQAHQLIGERCPHGYAHGFSIPGFKIEWCLVCPPPLPPQNG